MTTSIILITLSQKNNYRIHKISWKSKIFLTNKTMNLTDRGFRLNVSRSTAINDDRGDYYGYSYTILMDIILDIILLLLVIFLRNHICELISICKMILYVHEKILFYLYHELIFLNIYYPQNSSIPIIRITVNEYINYFRQTVP